MTLMIGRMTEKKIPVWFEMERDISFRADTLPAQTLTGIVKEGVERGATLLLFTSAFRSKSRATLVLRFQRMEKLREFLFYLSTVLRSLTRKFREEGKEKLGLSEEEYQTIESNVVINRLAERTK